MFPNGNLFDLHLNFDVEIVHMRDRLHWGFEGECSVKIGHMFELFPWLKKWLKCM